MIKHAIQPSLFDTTAISSDGRLIDATTRRYVKRSPTVKPTVKPVSIPGLIFVPAPNGGRYIDATTRKYVSTKKRALIFIAAPNGGRYIDPITRKYVSMKAVA